ncbi:hypothetical protein GOODEAATRI_030173 [Goodea atripinnis]|uniref:Reverse transcriptase n=1 Tax=Goodea atripinnis TaxID=208336 RepID=A0ABV0PSU5_9TELE
MVWADDAVVGKHNAARCHAQVAGLQLECHPRIDLCLPLEMDELLGLAMKQVRQTWMEQRKLRFTGAVGA